MSINEKEQIKEEIIKFQDIDNTFSRFNGVFFKIEAQIEAMNDSITLSKRTTNKAKLRSIKVYNENLIPQVMQSISFLHNDLEDLKVRTRNLNHFLIDFHVKNRLFNQIDFIQLQNEKLEDQLDSILVEVRKL